MEFRAINRLYTNDKEVRLYRPILKKLVKTTNGAIFLSQAIYWSGKNNHEWFYKFNGKCEHQSYKSGDSWEEELGFSIKEFKTVKKNIVFTVGNKVKEEYKNKFGDDWEVELSKKIDNSYIISYQTPNRLTYYKVNIKKINDELEKIYLNQDNQLETSEHQQNQLKTHWDFSFSKDAKDSTQQNECIELIKTSEDQQNQLKSERDFSKSTKGTFDISKTTTKNTKDPNGNLGISNEEEQEIKHQFEKTKKLITVSSLFSMSNPSVLFLNNKLIPLAKEIGSQQVINALKEIYLESRTDKIKDLEALIKSKIKNKKSA